LNDSFVVLEGGLEEADFGKREMDLKSGVMLFKARPKDDAIVGDISH
jgi:hypothetical protein